jgi:hypothetical protein
MRGPSAFGNHGHNACVEAKLKPFALSLSKRGWHHRSFDRALLSLVEGLRTNGTLTQPIKHVAAE